MCFFYKYNCEIKLPVKTLSLHKYLQQRMNLGPDGSLCRVTSSAKDLINNVRIMKVSDSDIAYRLVLIRPNDKESSEESDEEISSDEDQLPSKENEKIEDKKFGSTEKPNKTASENVMRERNHHKRPRHQHKKNNFKGQKNNFNKGIRQYKSLSKMKGVFEYGNKDFNSTANFDFNSQANPNLSYKRDNFQHPPVISPWVKPPVMRPNYQFEQFPHMPIPNNPRNSLGLLGDRPLCAPSHDQNSSYTPMSSNFQSSTNNDAFNCDQTSLFSPMPSNNHNDSFGHIQNSSFTPMTSNSHNNFVHNQNSFSHMPSNYPPNKQADNFVRDQKFWKGNYNNYRKNNQYRNKHSNDNNERNQSSWNRKPRRQPNVRNNSSRNNPSFDYRN